MCKEKKNVIFPLIHQFINNCSLHTNLLQRVEFKVKVVQCQCLLGHCVPPVYSKVQNKNVHFPISREAYPCANGSCGMSIFLLYFLFVLPKSCAIEVYLLVSADDLCRPSSSFMLWKLISMISSKNLCLENRNSECWINLDPVLNDSVCASDLGDVSISNAGCWVWRWHYLWRGDSQPQTPQMHTQDQ